MNTKKMPDWGVFRNKYKAAKGGLSRISRSTEKANKKAAK